MSDAALLGRITRLEAESDIRRLVARYFQICDALGPDTPFDELGELFSQNALWEGQGRYAQAFGRYEGRAAIVDMIRAYCIPEPHFAMTAHFFSAEDIRIEGAAFGRGKWMMLQTSDYADGRADFRAASLSMQFKHEDGQWRISRFLTRNIFSRQVERWNDEVSIPVPDLVSGAAQ